jgi:putative transposase
MVERDHPDLSGRQQCALMSIPRSSLYYTPQGETEENLALKRLMGLMPIYQKPNTSRPAKGHKTDPYLLRVLRVDRPNQVWCVDITYLPMRRGFLYLEAIMDWHTQMVLSRRISNTLEADFCVEALNEVIYRFGPPDIMNSHQGFPVHVI